MRFKIETAHQSLASFTRMQITRTLLSMTFLLSACAAPQPPLAVYGGPERPLRDVASIRGSNVCDANGLVIGETRITEINGSDAQSFNKGFQRDLLVAPGQLALTAVWFYANVRTKEPASLQLNASAGHRYIVRAQSDYKERVAFNIEDLGPKSGETEFVYPLRPDGKPSNCY